MIDADKLAMKRHGGYIRHLRAEQSLSLEAFADKLQIKPAQLKDIEDGNIEADTEVVARLPDVSNATWPDIHNIFRERWRHFC